MIPLLTLAACTPLAVAKEDPATIELTRVIPTSGGISVEWLPSRVAIAAYRLEAKLRDAPWNAVIASAASGRSCRAQVRGLQDHADYALRVVGLDDQGQVVATSVERLATPAWAPGVVIDYLHRDDLAFAEHGRYIGSPSLVRLPDGSLLASHDLFGPGPQNLTRLFKSPDRGRTWRWLTDLTPAFWGKLFLHGGALYLLATRTEYGDLLLRRSCDGGATWEGPVVIAPGPYHKAPVPVIEHLGRLWTCVELQTGGWPAGFKAVVCSVSADGNLMDPAAWTVSAPLPYDPAWLPRGFEVAREDQGYLEGNAVVDPQGRLLNILRYNTPPHSGRAIVLAIAEDGRSLRFERVIDFPGGMVKFTIGRHPGTGVYWSVVNRVTHETMPGMRNVLSLISSPDLTSWTVRRDLLRDDSPWAVQYTGFQYVDWEFDGRNIIAACRTALNGAHNFHDANYLTFHRFGDVGPFGPGKRQADRRGSRPLAVSSQ